MNETPWMDWFEKRRGWKESNPTQNSLLSRGWKYVKLTFNNITGRSHAWCAMSLASALKETGYSIQGVNAAAISFRNYGTPCEPKRGAILVIRHSGGSHHVTCIEHVIHNEHGNIVFDCLGGNQGDQIKTSRYNVSGGKGQDSIVAIRWPVKA